MSMVKPIGSSQVAFDATKDQYLYFTSTGGNQVVKNKVIIRLNSSNKVIYENTKTTYAFNQLIPANTLTNGNYYNFSFITYDINDDSSEESTQIPFYCYTTPTVVINDLTNNQTISNATHVFSATYNQKEGEYLGFLKFYLYDSSNKIVDESNNLYSINQVPINFSFKHEGFENNSSYKINVVATSINGTVVTSESINFNILYVNPILFSTLDLENKCDDGYVQLVSNIIIADGKISPEPPDYVENETKLNLTSINSSLKWDKGFSIDKDFVLELWYEIGLSGKQFKLVNSSNPNNYFIGNWVREIPYGEETVKDYVEITGYINNIETFYMRSNYVNIVNNSQDIILWFKFNPKDLVYELMIQVNERTDNYLNWGVGASNTIYNRLTTLQSYKPVMGTKEWNFKSGERITSIDGNGLDVGCYFKKDFETYKIGVQKENVYGDMSSVFPITNVELYNGIYDNIDISNNIVKTFSADKPIWNYCTHLNCDFNGNINGGNVNITLSQLNEIKLKSRQYGDVNWVTLYTIPINSVSDLYITKQDYRVPSGVKMEYALVPVLSGGTEGEYLISSIDIKWNKLFVTDSNGTTLSLESNVAYSGNTSNMAIGSLQPIGRAYPTFIQNGATDYETGSISGNILQENFKNYIDRTKVVSLVSQWNNILKNGHSKIIKDWNGNIWLARISSSPTMTYNQSIGNGFGSVSFTFATQGKWNVQNDLYENDIIEVE